MLKAIIPFLLSALLAPAMAAEPAPAQDTAPKVIQSVRDSRNWFEGSTHTPVELKKCPKGEPYLEYRFKAHGEVEYISKCRQVATATSESKNTARTNGEPASSKQVEPAPTAQ